MTGGPSPAQLRAGRAWLGLSRSQLAQRAGLCDHTVQKAEAGHPSIRPHTISALVGAFTASGILFVGRQTIARTDPPGVSR